MLASLRGRESLRPLPQTSAQACTARARPGSELQKGPGWVVADAEHTAECNCAIVNKYLIKPRCLWNSLVILNTLFEEHIPAAAQKRAAVEEPRRVRVVRAAPPGPALDIVVVRWPAPQASPATGEPFTV